MSGVLLEETLFKKLSCRQRFSARRVPGAAKFHSQDIYN
jgi:hypothetical protein